MSDKGRRKLGETEKYVPSRLSEDLGFHTQCEGLGRGFGKEGSDVGRWLMGGKWGQGIQRLETGSLDLGSNAA